MRLPSASSLRARARTSKAPSVPSRDMRSAKCTAVFAISIRILVDAEERAAVDSKRLAGDESRLARAEERACRANLLRLTQTLERHTRGPGIHVAQPGQRVGPDGVGGQAVDGDPVGRELGR